MSPAAFVLLHPRPLADLHPALLIVPNEKPRASLESVALARVFDFSVPASLALARSSALCRTTRRRRVSLDRSSAASPRLQAFALPRVTGRDAGFVASLSYASVASSHRAWSIHILRGRAFPVHDPQVVVAYPLG
jgi:hypothetical protein